MAAVKGYRSKIERSGKWTKPEQAKEAIVDAKWNNVIDRFLVRSVMLAVAFGVWLAISYGVLAA